MKSRTFCFNKAVFRKDMTRFAPVGVLYTLCLIAGLMLMVDSQDTTHYWFASHMADCCQYMSAVNLVYGPILAALLFGDLYNSRMCNGLHAMPLRRQELFVTHILSGLVYSLLPTAVMALLSMPLLGRTIVTDAWQIGVYWWLAANLQFVCCFGIAVFAALCAGNWLGMGAMYAGVQGGSVLVFSLVDSFYTTMLEGVQTGEWLAMALSPVNNLAKELVEVESYQMLCRRFQGQEDMAASFSLTENWKSLLLWAGVGVAFMAVAWLLYRKRDLESAGDPIAVKPLVPVTQVCGSLALGGLAAMVFRELLSNDSGVLAYGMLFAAIAVAWLAVRMVLSRTSRVFEKKTILGLLPLLGVVALSLVATYFDVFGVETWVPDVSQVQSVTVSCYGQYRSDDPQIIQAVIDMHREALGDPIPQSGRYDKTLLEQGLSLTEVYQKTQETEYTDEEIYLERVTRTAYNTYITYDLGHGRTVERHYVVWLDGENGELMRALSADWDTYYWEKCQYGNVSQEYPVTPEELDTLYIQRYNKGDYLSITAEDAQSLLEAVKADCLAGNMSSHWGLHQGIFRYIYTDDEGQEQCGYETGIYLDLSSENEYQWSTERGTTVSWGVGVQIDVYPDSVNTIQWLQQRGYLNYEVVFPEGTAE